ncbi:uncharacterized protein [Arachis hypogaea]|uniref:uncharacterized protein n=1 Tax=Arachis hypogaea TaxID=3818 RepID=UPI003B218EB9
MEDFNEVVHTEERKGATSLSASAEDFRAWINDMELVNLMLNDRKYTWFRGQSCSRIDRSLEEWRGLGDAQFLDMLKAVSKPLGRWYKQHFGNIREKIKKFEDEIKKVDDMKASPNISFQDGLVNQLETEEAQVLEVLPSEEEVKDAVSDCESSKAPGSDGYNMNFINKCWEKIGVEFTKAVLIFFETARLPTDSNVT